MTEKTAEIDMKERLFHFIRTGFLTLKGLLIFTMDDPQWWIHFDKGVVAFEYFKNVGCEHNPYKSELQREFYADAEALIKDFLPDAEIKDWWFIEE